MAKEIEGLDEAFLRRQRVALEKLRDALLRTQRAAVEERRSANDSTNAEAHEYEDEAQKLSTLELSSNVSVVNEARLSNVQRALQKLDEGSYGLSEQSGVAISRERLEASPEALYTVSEQEAIDR